MKYFMLKFSIPAKVCDIWQGWSKNDTVKTLNIGTPRLTTIVVLNIKQFNFYNAVMPQKDVDRLANSVDPDQTAP